MSIKWNKQSFRALKELCQNGPSTPEMCEEELTRRNRYGNIQCMLDRDLVLPPVTSPEMSKFKTALCEALCRLPERAFDQVESEIGFFVEDPSTEMIAVNVAARQLPGGRGKRAIDTIVVFRAGLKLSPDALIGLIAHEIAHSFVCGSDYQADEALVDKKARAWGFRNELDCLAREKEALRGGSRS